MTIDILISTIDHGIQSVPGVLLPQKEGVGYVVSMQYTSEKYLSEIPDELKNRPDVKLLTLPGRGLSHNRNNAMENSTADVILIADDDERLMPDAVDNILRCYAENPDLDIALFHLDTIDGRPFKDYPTHEEIMDYEDACDEGYYPSSLEISMRLRTVSSGLRFDERFGLGSGIYPCGEEDVLLHHALKFGLNICLFPVVIAQTIDGTTGSRFLYDKDIQRAKGAVFRQCYGWFGALWRITKEAIYHFIHGHHNPFPLFFQMFKGVRNK